MRALNDRLAELSLLLDGDGTIASRHEPVPWSVRGRTFSLYYAISGSQNKVSGNHLSSLEIAEAEYSRVAEQLKALRKDLDAFEAEMESLGAPWTPGRIPTLD